MSQTLLFPSPPQSPLGVPSGTFRHDRSGRRRNVWSRGAQLGSSVRYRPLRLAGGRGRWTGIGSTFVSETRIAPGRGVLTSPSAPAGRVGGLGPARVVGLGVCVGAPRSRPTRTRPAGPPRRGVAGERTRSVEPESRGARTRTDSSRRPEKGSSLPRDGDGRASG